jgi:hypothetical protein
MGPDVFVDHILFASALVTNSGQADKSQHSGLSEANLGGSVSVTYLAAARELHVGRRSHSWVEPHF